jgi:hypothetical protein
VSGDLLAEVTVTPAGNVTDPEISIVARRGPKLNSIADSEILKCLKMRILLLKFPLPKKGWTVRLSYPLRFGVRNLK